MASHVEIKSVNFAEDSLYKTQTVQIRGKSFKTPIKAMDLNRYIVGLNINPVVKGVNEICKKFNSTRINTALTTNREEEINREIDAVKKKYSSEDDVNICFVEFEENNLPNQIETDYLTNLSYAHSDITPLPIIPKFFKVSTSDINTRFMKYCEFINNAIATINIHNQKPIMGIMPMSLPTIFMPELIEIYRKEGINSIFLDFQGATVNGAVTKIRNLVMTLKRQSLLENTFIYSLNLGPGKLPKSKDVVPAKDILSFGYGFDSIGGMHVQKKLPPEVRERILRSQNIFEYSLRLFNKQDYGYYRASKPETIHKIYPGDSSIPPNILERSRKIGNVDKLFNQEQLGLEAVNLRSVINQNSELLKYLGTKQYVEKNDIKILSKIKTKK